jgi:hypothetical protein
VRSLTAWRRAARSFLDDPDQDNALVLVSVLVDSRAVWGQEAEPLIAETFRLARARQRLLRLLAEFAIAHRPPTGFLRGLVVEFSGEHRRRLDLKTGGIVPIADIARWAGLAAGVTCASTTARLAAAGEAGMLTAFDALTFQEAFELVCQLRLDHQVAQLQAGVEPDYFLPPSELNPLTRSYLKEAFRAVTSVQRHISTDLALTRVLRRHGVRLRGPILDTRDLGELLALERGVPSAAASLSELARSLGLPVRRPHHALGDALTTAQVFIALATHLDEFAPQTVRSLAVARKRTRTLRMYPGGAG